MRTATTIVQTTMAQLLTKIATMGSALVVSRLVASQSGLGSLGYKDIGVVTAYAAYFYIVADFGLNAIAVKQLSQSSQPSTLIAHLVSLRLIMAVSLMAIGALALVFIPNYSAAVKLAIVCQLLTILCQALLTTANAAFQLQLNYWPSTLAVAVGAAITIILTVIVYSQSGPLLAYILAGIAGSVTAAGVAVWYLYRRYPFRLHLNWSVWISLLGQAAPLGAAIILNLIYIRFGYFWLSLIDNSSYGYVTAASRLFDIVLVVPIFVVNGLYPLLLARNRQGWPALKKLVIKSLLACMAIALPISLVVWWGAPLAIDLTVNNPTFAPSIALLRSYALLIPLFFITNILLWTTIALGKQASIVVFYSIGAVLSLALNLWLLPIWGYQGLPALIGMVETVVGLLMVLQLMRHNQRQLRGNPFLERTDITV